jgi:protoporphyrinogen oxidase
MLLDSGRRIPAPHGARDVVAVIGAGPAGLTAAYELGCADVPAVVYESSHAVGGISRTVQRDGWRFDIGGHRFFTKVPAVDDFWHRVLADEDFLTRPRMSRIYYRGKLYDYPLKPLNALRNLGLFEATRCVLSYAAVRVRPPRDQSNFEGWVAARFGWRLYRTFFKTYTEKVWGVDATEIRADWAAQRIKNLSLLSAIRNAILPAADKTVITSLIEQFQYPKLGPGMMWERTRDLVEAMGIPVRMRSTVIRIEHSDGMATAVIVRVAGQRAESDRLVRTPVSAVISSMPLAELVSAMSPAAPADVVAAARALRYRDFLTVALVVPKEKGFPDNWIYVHDPSVAVGRIQNYGSWSPYMVRDRHTCLGLEYFVNEDDDLWCMPDDDLVELGRREISRLGLVSADAVTAGYVVRQPKAYPVYDEHYQRNVDEIRHWLADAAPNVHPVGRNGMHRYNNADHSMLTAMLTVENITGHEPPHDIWEVNVEQDYHEQAVARTDGRGTGRDAPLLPAARSAAA